MSEKPQTIEDIPQEWLDEIHRVSQYMIHIGSIAFAEDSDHLSDVAGFAGHGLEKVIELLDPARWYDLDGEQFQNVLTPYDSDEDDESR